MSSFADTSTKSRIAVPGTACPPTGGSERLAPVARAGGSSSIATAGLPMHRAYVSTMLSCGPTASSATAICPRPGGCPDLHLRVHVPRGLCRERARGRLPELVRGVSTPPDPPGACAAGRHRARQRPSRNAPAAGVEHAGRDPHARGEAPRRLTGSALGAPHGAVRHRASIVGKQRPSRGGSHGRERGPRSPVQRAAAPGCAVARSADVRGEEPAGGS